MEGILGYVIGGIILLGIVGRMIERARSRPSADFLIEVEQAIARLQEKAVQKVKGELTEGEVEMFDSEQMRANETTVQDTIRFIFTVDRKRENLLYIISSQLIQPKPHKFQVQCMQLAMIVLNQQLKRAGIRESDVQFELDRSEMGTDYIYMQLSEGQHERYVASLSN